MRCKKKGTLFKKIIGKELRIKKKRADVFVNLNQEKLTSFTGQRWSSTDNFKTLDQIIKMSSKH